MLAFSFRRRGGTVLGPVYGVHCYYSTLWFDGDDTLTVASSLLSYGFWYFDLAGAVKHNRQIHTKSHVLSEGIGKQIPKMSSQYSQIPICCTWCIVLVYLRLKRTSDNDTKLVLSVHEYGLRLFSHSSTISRTMQMRVYDWSASDVFPTERFQMPEGKSERKTETNL